jgi:lactate dehydrogenase-like 2-hydroxyacid dehydrogenase
MTQKFKVLVTRKWPNTVEKKLDENFDVTLNESDIPMTEDQLLEAMNSYDAVLPTVTDSISSKVISSDKRKAKIIGNFGVGFNNIDIESAKSNGVVVTNTPEVLTDCTADIAMLLLLGVSRRASEGEFHVRKKEWSGWRPTHMMGTKVTGKTLGLVGMGRIAQAVAQKAHFGFNMKILFFDPYFNNNDIINKFNALPCKTLDDLLKDSDFVSLHCPSTSETKGLMNIKTLAKMKKSSYLINTARGDVVVENDLVQALESGIIKGAGLDVFEGEPNVNPKLLNFKNVFLLPHLGSATEETREAMGMRVFSNIRDFFDGKEPTDRVV